MNTDNGRVGSIDLGLLIIRIMLAVVFMFHGGQKLFGWFDGPGIDGFAAGLEKMQVPMPKVSAVLAASAEFFGGLLVGVGFLTRIAIVPMVITMMVASFKVHGAAFSLQHGGMEYALTLGVILIGLFFTGPGRLSLDAALSRSRRTTEEV